MLTRFDGHMWLREDRQMVDVARQLETDGYTLVPAALTPHEIDALKADMERVFDEVPVDARHDRKPLEQWRCFRFELLNHSALAEDLLAHPKIREVIEPVLGEDCHVISHTAWWQRADIKGVTQWHIDAGPHVPRPVGIPWDDRIPYPIFAVGVHIYLSDCPTEAGPTAVVPKSHTSGRFPPIDRLDDDELDYEGRRPVTLIANAGDIGFFSSDTWHRREAPSGDNPGRMFIQAHYGRRDIAQRLRPAALANHLSDDAIARAHTERERTVVGLHELDYYDG